MMAKIAMPANTLNGSAVARVCWYASNVPLSPARNEPIANAANLVRDTLIPAAAADLSLARTASMAEPSRLRRSRPTPTAAITTMIRHRIPNEILG